MLFLLLLQLLLLSQLETSRQQLPCWRMTSRRTNENSFISRAQKSNKTILNHWLNTFNKVCKSNIIPIFQKIRSNLLGAPRHKNQKNSFINNTIAPGTSIPAEIATTTGPGCPKYFSSLDTMDKEFKLITFNYLTQKSPINRQENGISFVISGVFLHLLLVAVSTLDTAAENEIDAVTHLSCPKKMKTSLIRDVISKLPLSDKSLTLRWSSRLVLAPHRNVDLGLLGEVKDCLHLRVLYLNNTDNLVNMFNEMIEEDSRGVMHDTFDETDFTEGVEAVLLSTIYFRCRWRTSPVLLNGTFPFYDGIKSSSQVHNFTQSIRINDVMGYADLQELNAEAIEIEYATEGLSLLMVIPRGTSLRELAYQLGEMGPSSLTHRLNKVRISLQMPIYTMRMTLLLPDKLKAMGISKLLNEDRENKDQMINRNELKLSHGVQRIMFWAEAGQNAFKDDGMDWDIKPDMDFLIDRPYVFYVRFNGITILSGNFVL